MKLKQSRWASFGEQCVNTFSGFGLSLFLQWLYFDWWLGLPLHPFDNLVFAIVMTVVSLARGFSVRRLFEATGLRAILSPAMQQIIAERSRQQTVECFDEAHDDAHKPGELAAAGACYLLTTRPAGSGDLPPAAWPWGDDWWKPADVRRNLVRGLALGLAELERHERMRKRKGRAAS